MDTSRGFSLVELLVAIGILSLVLVMVLSLVFWMQYYHAKVKADKEVAESARRAMDTIIYEIRHATDVYVSTTSAGQLSLETTRYVPAGESVTFIDFFLCGTAVCMKKESQTPIALTPDAVEFTNLQFARVVNSTATSVTVTLQAQYKNANADSGNVASTTISSTASLRNY